MGDPKIAPLKLTNAQKRALKQMLIPGMVPAGVGATRRVHRTLVAKGLCRWLSNKNIAATCEDDEADWILINPEGRRALEIA
jgi:hypothetical protein